MFQPVHIETQPELQGLTNLHAQAAAGGTRRTPPTFFKRRSPAPSRAGCPSLPSLWPG